MDDTNIDDHMDHQKWLLNNGFINDLHKDNLYMYGGIVHSGIKAVELDIAAMEKKVSYTLFCSKKLIKNISKWHTLKNSTNVLDLWGFKRLLKKEGTLDFNHLISGFVKDYCGPAWKIKIEIKGIHKYEEGPHKQEES